MQDLLLGVEAVCHDAAFEVGRSAGQGRKARGDGAARAALGCGEGLSPFGEQLVYQLLHGGRFVADDVVGNDPAQRFELPFDLLRYAFSLDLVG